MTETENRDGDLAQESVNYIRRMDPWGRMTADVIRSCAATRHAEYPQYNGHWDEAGGWILVTVTHRVETKLGVAFEPGDNTLGKRSGFLVPGCWTVYSIRNGCDTQVTSGVNKV